MRITVQHALKVPAEQEYSSRQHSVAMEVDVPEEVVAQGKEALRAYVEKVAAEVRSYVESALAEPVSGRAPLQRTASRSAPPPRPALRASVHANGRANGSRRPEGPVENGNGHHGGSGGPDAPASIKQVNFLRGLAKDAGYSPDQLSFLAEDALRRPEGGVRVPLLRLPFSEG